jgi:hypothetical protein
MRIPSDEIPQADRLSEVLRTVICISQGGQSFQEIAAFINKVERQGRYYRKAAEIIGMVETPVRNQSVLTPLGQQFIQSGATLNNPLLIQSVLNSRIFQRIIPFLELRSATGVIRDRPNTKADLAKELKKLPADNIILGLNIEHHQNKIPLVSTPC